MAHLAAQLSHIIGANGDEEENDGRQFDMIHQATQ
jgi:hypothetical protein